ncbi:MAG: class I SAM-dependent methyltransferase [Planctomycetota bacterium]|nr:class I SAM-dependent methyltransferase [Planctomycetota bacterium]
MPQPLVEPTYYYSDLEEIGGGDGVWDLATRWADVRQHAALRPDDEVLDLGCAEGLIAIEVAKVVRHVHGVELRPERVEAADRIARDRGIDNVTFQCASVADLALEPRSFDVVLFLGVLQHLPREHKLPTLAKALSATRRQVVMRMPLFDPRSPNRATNLAAACQDQDFTLTIYPRHAARGGNLIIAQRYDEPGSIADV